MSTLRTFGSAAGAAAIAGGLVLVATPASAADTATVSVLHAVPDTPVDVYANGERLIDDFQPGTLTDPLQRPAGNYDLALFPADAADGSGEPLLSANGVAVPAGQARVTVRHTAAAPAVDVRAGGQAVVKGLTNPTEETLTVPAGTISADVVLAGTDTVAIGPADLTLAEGTTTIVHAWGSEGAGTPPPPAEPVGGQVLPFRRRPRLLLVAAAVAGAVVGAGVVGLVRGGEVDGEAVAAVALDALTDEPASGRAEVVLREDGYRALQVGLEAPAVDGEYYELWLIEPGVVDMVPLGVLRPGEQTLELPSGLDPGEFPIVDVSVEPLDGDPTHSGVSVARGVLES